MTDQEIAQTLKDIQASLSNRWWQALLIILAGAIPSALVAWINYRWNKKLFELTRIKDQQFFDLNKEKEEKLFNLNKEKEDIRLIAELVGDLNAAYLQIKKLADDYGAKWVVCEYHKARINTNDPKLAMVTKVDLVVPIDEFVQSQNALIDSDTTLIKLLSRYKSLTKDKKLDELIRAYRGTTAAGTVNLEGFTATELQALNLDELIHLNESKYTSKYKAALSKIIDHIMYTHA